MPVFLGAPVASEDITVHADFLELYSVKNADRTSSMVDLIRAIRRTGSVDAIEADDGFDRGSEQTEVCAESAFSEIEDRIGACTHGGLNRYPFTVDKTGQLLISLEAADRSSYVFMLLLTSFGLKAGRAGDFPERLFEELCRHAAEKFLGGVEEGAEAVRFGSPRTTFPKRFGDAIEELCMRVGDMEPARHRAVTSAKDAQLDIVAWRHFPDRRPGKLVIFGQCAAGQHQWRLKAKELQLSSFTKRWLAVQPSVDPLRMFFVPWRIPRDEHRESVLTAESSSTDVGSHCSAETLIQPC